MHRFTNQLPSELIEVTNNFTTKSTTSKYNFYYFYKIVINIRASKYFTAGYGQFQALQHTNSNIILDKTTKGIIKVQFGIRTSLSIKFTTVNILISQVQFYVMLLKTPFLLSLADIDKLNVYFNNLTNTLVTLNGLILTVRRFGHSFLLWDTSFQVFIAESFAYNPCFLTTIELQRLYCRFGYPLVGKLQKVLE